MSELSSLTVTVKLNCTVKPGLLPFPVEARRAVASIVHTSTGKGGGGVGERGGGVSK